MPLRILIVEDNEMNRDMLSRRLQRVGYVVITAVDGAEGISVATQELPDLILMDLSLPVMDGWTAARQLKQQPSTASIPIIALSAHTMPADRERALASGCDDFDIKPIQLNRLLAKMHVLLGIDAECVSAGS